MCCGLSAVHQPRGSLRPFLFKACIVLLSSSCFSLVASSLHAISFEPEHQRPVLKDVHLHGSIRQFRPGRLFLREIDDPNTQIQFKDAAASFDAGSSAHHRAAHADTNFCRALGWQFPPKGNQDEPHQRSWVPLEWQVSERDVACLVCHVVPHRPRAANCRRCACQRSKR
jgi:hypothetical protein